MGQALVIQAEGPEFKFQHAGRKPRVVLCPWAPRTREMEQGDPQGLPGGLSSPICELEIR